MNEALQIINDTIDPEFPNGIVPTGAQLIDIDEPTEWITWTGTYYPTLESVPWQAKGSAVEVPARQ